MSTFYQGASSSTSPIPRPITVRDGAPPPRVFSAEEQDSWLSPEHRKSEKLVASTQRLPWPAELHRAMSMPRRYHTAMLSTAKRNLQDHPDVTRPLSIYSPPTRSRSAPSGYRTKSPAASSRPPYSGIITAPSARTSFTPSLGPVQRTSLRSSPDEMKADNLYGSPADLSFDLASPPLSGSLRHMRSPRPESSISQASRRHTSLPLTVDNQVLLEQYANELRARQAAGFAENQQYQQQLLEQKQREAAILVEQYQRATGSVLTPAPAASASNAKSYYAQPANPYMKGYGAQSPMSVAGLTQNSGGPVKAKKPTYQRYEQWADHDYLHELEMDRSQRGILCFCCE